jgi:hypothetical protein
MVVHPKCIVSLVSMDSFLDIFEGFDSKVATGC